MRAPVSSQKIVDLVYDDKIQMSEKTRDILRLVLEHGLQGLWGHKHDALRFPDDPVLC